MKSTNLIILLCVIASFYYWFVDSQVVDQFLVFKATAFLNGVVWTPATALFIHGNLFHLVGNMIFLYVFGNTLEDALGAKATVSAFFLGGICSFLLSVPYYGMETSMIGASAAIFTLSATVMLIKPLKFSWIFLMPLGLVAVLYFLYNLLAIYYGTQGSVGYVAHVIGFVLGLPLGISWSQGRWVKNVFITIVLFILYIVLRFMVQYLFGVM